MDVQSFTSLRCYWLNNHFYSLRKTGKNHRPALLKQSAATETLSHTQTHTVTLGELHQVSEKDDKRPAVSRGSVLPAHPLHLHQQLAVRSVQLNCTKANALLIFFFFYVNDNVSVGV